MSVVINYVSKNISVIATDTRVSFGEGGGKLGLYTDNNIKLLKLHGATMGWTAGAGLGEFLDEFKSQIANLEINQPMEVENFIKIYENVNECYCEKNPDLKESIDKSVISFSYLGAMEKEISMRIGILRKDLNSDGDTLLRVNDERFYIFYPIEYIDNPNLIKELKNGYSFEYTFNDLNTLLYKILEIFNEIRKNSNSVSDICDIGIHFINKEGIFKIRIKDNVEILLKDITLNRINTKMQMFDQLIF